MNTDSKSMSSDLKKKKKKPSLLRVLNSLFGNHIIWIMGS